MVEPDLLIDLKHLSGMREITHENGGFRIGAAVSGAELGEHAGVNALWPGVVEGMELIGSTQVQGRATMVGNCATDHRQRILCPPWLPQAQSHASTAPTARVIYPFTKSQPAQAKHHWHAASSSLQSTYPHGLKTHQTPTFALSHAPKWTHRCVICRGQFRIGQQGHLHKKQKLPSARWPQPCAW